MRETEKAALKFKEAFSKVLDIGDDDPEIQRIGKSEFYARYRSAVIATITQRGNLTKEALNKIIKDLNDENYSYILVNSSRLVRIERILFEFEILVNGNKDIQRESFRNCGI